MRVFGYSLEHNLPDSPFASPKAAGDYTTAFSDTAGEVAGKMNAAVLPWNLLTITWSVHPYFLQLPHWIWLLSNPVTFKCQGINFPPFIFLEISSFVNLCRYNSTKVMISGSLLAMVPLECRTHLGLASFTFYVSNHTSIILKLFYFIGVNQFGCDVFLVFGFVFFFLTGRLKRSNQQPRTCREITTAAAASTATPPPVSSPYPILLRIQNAYIRASKRSGPALVSSLLYYFPDHLFPSWSWTTGKKRSQKSQKIKQAINV